MTDKMQISGTSGNHRTGSIWLFLVKMPHSRIVVSNIIFHVLFVSFAYCGTYQPLLSFFSFSRDVIKKSSSLKTKRNHALICMKRMKRARVKIESFLI